MKNQLQQMGFNIFEAERIEELAQDFKKAAAEDQDYILASYIGEGFVRCSRMMIRRSSERSWVDDQCRHDRWIPHHHLHSQSR